MSSNSSTTPYQVPKEPGRWRALALAALVHGLLLVFLWIGVRWQNETPVAVEAEVWSPQPREAAPAPEPKPEPEPQPIARAEPRPTPDVSPPPPAKQEIKPEPKPVEKPDIALEQEKKRKAEERKRREEEEERREELKRKEALKQKQLEQDKAERAKLEKEKAAQLAKEKADKEKADKLAREKAEKDKAEKLAKEQADKEKADKLAKEKAAADAKRKAQEKADRDMLDKMRNEEMKRMAGGVAGTGGSGDAPKSQGGGRANSEYAARVGAKIRSNITFNVPDDLAGNPAAEFRVDLLPDGSIAGITQVKSSGVKGFDEAVRRAIERSAPFPKDKSGSVPSSFIGIHKPKDQ
ncbi:Cell division and transport-associated protein TolA [Noviherbaspirillum humi]|uniref:Cell division and transport-associated protein TolA n=1 Tax=Noviherbaspirillum humi TaxID=1688639 RepID=A0A239DIM0_9BURK|nr:cell envelope integrity protein TolA [Noviherbaspirillum humi]SNS32256.1 Cell division and transport-associated protein TolA [Noviherbaspirillum humi]